MLSLFRKLVLKWKGYRYRFVPWIAYNLNKKPVKCLKRSDIIFKQEDITQVLQNLFQAFYDNFHDHSSGEKERKSDFGHKNESAISQRHREILKEKLGFCIQKWPSKMEDGGSGVKVTEGTIPAGHLAAIYPGTVYRPDEPLFFQSIGNPFILKCADGILIDGNDRSLSKYIYKSCVYRDRIGPYQAADISWLTNDPRNPLAIGQFVNNQSKESECNVIYQEFDIPNSFPLHLRCYIPNIYNRPINSFDDVPQPSHINNPSFPWMRIVGLIAIRNIQKEEELLSSYYTIIH